VLQAERLQLHIAQLQEQLDAAALREEQIRLEAQAAAEERFDIQLQQQQLKYERHIQVRACRSAEATGRCTVSWSLKCGMLSDV